jgi:hypothetical protein
MYSSMFPCTRPCLHVLVNVSMSSSMYPCPRPCSLHFLVLVHFLVRVPFTYPAFIIYFHFDLDAYAMFMYIFIQVHVHVYFHAYVQVQDGAVNRGLVLGGLLLPPLGDCDRQYQQNLLCSSPSDGVNVVVGAGSHPSPCIVAGR